MMKRPIFPWMGLIVLFLSAGLSQNVLAKEQYTVRRGDTLAKISAKTRVSIQDLKAANHLTSASLKPNHVLVIPQDRKKTLAKSRNTTAPRVQPTRYVVKKGDTLYSIATRSHVSVNALKSMNNLHTQNLKIGQRLVLAGPLKAKPPATKVVAIASKEELPPVEDRALSEEESDEAESEAKIEDWDAVDKVSEIQTDSALLGKWSNPGERKLFVRVVMGFLGAPYRFGGSSVRGLDCSAFVKKIYQFFDVDLPRTAREQARVGKCVTRDSLEEGDLVFFNTRRALGHVGIYIGNNEFVHASSRDRAVKIDSLNSGYYSKRFVRAVRVKELDRGV